ncbi:S-adenosylmethionine/S-adenosylhomocysteine transporter [Paenibacillus konkukensis]|uniref:S-adenosylmethionine/S-adenosylhomocysteine transporter n=1 Tax=Paenibacillus konkukensis TaxID=2020716 RepID=A0ABY4RMP1_9BACL|nr:MULTISPECIES: DMT family transporter [Paenibacillus]UQZ83448.1 S-adenosylmethionine/S-adenosylhomocysteine transporter [Paenibacillus konkukensis]
MSHRAVILRLLGVSLLWGCNYVASAYLLRDFSPIFLSYSRLVLTSLFLISVAFVNRKMKRPTLQEWLILIFAGLFGTLFNQFFYFTGLQHSTAGNASLIIALSPVATTFLARMFLGESITVNKLTGAGLALVGVVLIVLFGGKSIGISQGDILLVLAMLALSISLLFIRKLSSSMPSYDITILATVIGTVLMTPAALWEASQGQMHFSMHLTMWLLLTCVAILGQGLASFWWNQGISEVGASTSSMFMNIPPFIAIIVAYLVLGDAILPAQIAGGILILTGVAVSNRRSAVPAAAA